MLLSSRLVIATIMTHCQHQHQEQHIDIMNYHHRHAASNSLICIIWANPGPSRAQARPRAWAQAEPGEIHGILLHTCYCMQNVAMYGDRVRAHARAQGWPEPRPRAGARPSPAKMMPPLLMICYCVQIGIHVNTPFPL